MLPIITGFSGPLKAVKTLCCQDLLYGGGGDRWDLIRLPGIFSLEMADNVTVI